MQGFHWSIYTKLWEKTRTQKKADYARPDGGGGASVREKKGPKQTAWSCRETSIIGANNLQKYSNCCYSFLNCNFIFCVIISRFPTHTFVGHVGHD